MIASISLRTYNREIESLIEGNQIEEAIAHCRHILERYPKHVATYRLLGKAYLEIQRYSDAEDVLQRVLSCIPDDFIAHLGLSIIREEAGDLETAIWHMERAFDVQPSNAAIQSELRRLYGRRDGTPPVKVTLTRGALARMSARSHLYSQAINELRAILAEDPQRPDLQVVLARLYFQTGQRNAAVETCSSLLNRLPNCLEANRILAEVLPSTERASEASYYKQRVEAIEPYSAYISPEYPSVDQVPDEVILLDRLVMGLTAELKPPNLAELETTAAVSGVEKESEQPLGPAAPEEEIPEWMRTAGWVAAAESTREKEAAPSPFVDETPQESDIPDWLRTLAPEEQPVQPEEEESEQPEGEEPPAWLSSPAAVAAGVAAAAFTKEEAAEPEGQPGEEPAPGESQEQLAAEPEALPDWLAESQTASSPTAAEEQVDSDREIPEWLAGTQAAEAAGAAVLGATTEVSREADEPFDEGSGQEIEAQEFGPAGVLEEPGSPAEWVVETGLEGEPETPVGGEETLPAAGGETTMAGEFGDQSVEPQPDQAEEQEEVPAWLQELSPPEIEPVVAQEPVEVAPQSEPETPEAADAATLAFLAALAPDDARGEQMEEAPAAAAAPDQIPDTTPDWLKELAGETELETSMEPPGAGEGPEPSESVPDWLRAISEGAPGESAPGEGWTVEAESATQEEILAPTESPAQGVPDWLQAAMAAGAAEAVEEEFSPPPAESHLEEPPVIEGDTRPVRLAGPPVEELIQAAPEVIQPEEGAPVQLEDQETTYAWLESVGAEPETVVPEVELLEEISVEERESEEGFALEPVEEAQEEGAPDWLETGAAAAGAGLVEQAGLEEQAGEPSAGEELHEEAATPPGATGSLAEILAAAGAVYAVDRSLEGEQPVAEPEVESEAAALEEQPEAELQLQASEWLEEPEAETGEAEPPEAGLAETELPEWLREYENVEPTPPADMEETEWFATAAATGLLDAAKLPPREPVGMLDLNAASQSQLERLPGVGFILAQNIVSFREQNGPFTSLDQLDQIPGVTPEIGDELRQFLTLTLVPESQPPASEIPELALAWQRLSAGDIPGAVGHYDRMIQQEQDLPEVIKEIQQALALYPGDASLYQALGDALMRTDRLQEALEAYDRAEDLLR